MSLWSWFFPSPADRIRQAQVALAEGRPAEARLAVMDLEGDEAAAVQIAAENALALLNLDEAIAASALGNDARAVEHVELANSFHHGAHPERFAAARAQIRGNREEREAAARRDAARREASLLAVDPLGLGHDDSLSLGSNDPEVEALAARTALLIEAWPEAHRPAIDALGPPFLDAMLDLEDGEAGKAMATLATLDERSAPVAWGRALASAALDDRPAAIRHLRRMAELAGGHVAVGGRHSGVMLADLLAASGAPAEGLAVLRALPAGHPGALLEALLREATGDLAGAEATLGAAIRAEPQQSALYRVLARVRRTGGHDVAGLAALEKGLESTKASPDRGLLRDLAIGYLETGLEPDRGNEVTAMAQSMPIDDPAWDDLWLMALHARRTGHPEAANLRERALSTGGPAGQQRVERIWPTS